jgi:hypothetical protein
MCCCLSFSRVVTMAVLWRRPQKLRRELQATQEVDDAERPNRICRRRDQMEREA